MEGQVYKFEVSRRKTGNLALEPLQNGQQLIVYCENCVQDSLAAKCVDWLKSLRPQHYWKPSDRQLAALLTAFGDEKKAGSDVATELIELYFDIKNL